MKKTMYIVSMLFITIVFFQTSHSVFATNQTPITRSQAEQRALSIVNLPWTFSKTNNTNIDSEYLSIVTLPKQLSNSTTSQMTGIPYCWGGLDSIDSSSEDEPWNNFLDAVKQGAYTGNIDANGVIGYVPGTAGLDCSGFVQAVFDIKDYKLSTSTLLDSYFKKIDLSQIEHMDILDYPGTHVVIFDQWGSSNGVQGAFTYESTTNQDYGGIQGTKRYFISMADINSGYIPARYINIVDDTTPTPAPTPTPTNPYPVNVGTFAKISDNTSWVNFRSAPSDNSNILFAIPSESIIYVNSYSSGWYNVIYQGKEGWIWGAFIAALQKGEYVTIKNAYTLNIRNNPSYTAKILGCLSQNQYARVIGYSQDGSWMQISINNIQGWASINYLSYIY